MGSFLSKVTQLLCKHGGKIIGVLAVGLSNAFAFFLGKNHERRKNEKRIAELQEAIRKLDAEITLFESMQKRSFRDGRELRRMRAEKAELEKELESYRQESVDA